MTTMMAISYKGVKMKIDYHKLKQILQGLIVEQATREFSGRDWMDDYLRLLNEAISKDK